MSIALSPCPACARHVKAGECMCPFCGAKVACVNAVATPGVERMSRSAKFAATALGTVLVTTGCATSAEPLYGATFPPESDDGSTVQPDSSASASDAPAPTDAAAEDAAVGDAGSSDAAAPKDAAEEGPSAVPLYGAIPPPHD